MKKLLTIAALLATSSAFAADSSSGCGLGWQVTQKQSLLASSTRNTTHAILPNTISMTSGISGCGRHSIVKAERATEHFVEANFENLQLEMAQGQGESLAVLGQLMGCDGEFATRAQSVDIASTPGEMIKRGCL